jgi:hypothetical protein
LISLPQAPRAFAKVEEKAGDHIWSIRRQESGHSVTFHGWASCHEVKISFTLKFRR